MTPSSLPSRGAVPHLPEGVTVDGRGEFLSNRILRDDVFQGLDPQAPLESYSALDELFRRLEHAEQKWHGHHMAPVYGPTCPLCKAEGR